MIKKFFIFGFIALAAFSLFGQKEDVIKLPLTNAEGLQLINVEVIPSDLNGKLGIKVTKDKPDVQDETLVLIKDVEFHNGIISLWLHASTLAYFRNLKIINQ